MKKVAPLLLLCTLACAGQVRAEEAATPAPSPTAVSTSAATEAEKQNLAEKQRLLQEKQRITTEKMKLLEQEQKLNDEQLKLLGGVPAVEAVPPVATENQKTSSGYHKHDGFFLRLAPGFGFAKYDEDITPDKVELSKSGGLFNFAIGGAISENIILHLDASAFSAKDPTLKVNGVERTSSITEISTSVVGLGLTYYFPSNSYITGSIGQALSTIKSNGVEYKTDHGVGANLMIGHEWWVSDNWGLGLAGQVLYATCPDKNGSIKSDLTTLSYGVMFSATYN